jgi:hypothetical protein
MDLATIILKFLFKVFELASAAWEAKDPSKLRKVADVFVDDHVLEAELVLAEARAKAIAEHKP